MKSRKLNCGDKSNPCDVYNSTIDPSSMVEFSNGAFKFFHSNIPSVIHLANQSYNVIEKVRLSDVYLTLDDLPEKYNDYLRGLLEQKQRMNLVGYTGEVSF